MIVAAPAEALGLHVPARTLLMLARDATSDDLARMTPEKRAAILWLDRFTREILAAAVAAVPDEFLRLRQADHVAFLWSRVQAPRAFAHAGPSELAPAVARG